MANPNCPSIIRLLAFVVLAPVLVASSLAQELPPAAVEMAKTYGLYSFSQVEGLRYTFNLEFPGVKVSRTWEWNPKTGEVTYQSKDKDGNPVKVTYKRSELSSQPDNVKNEVEPAFNNDMYWLLFPLHVVWDKSATVTDEGMQKLPIGDGSADKIVVKYAPAVGGYTPGDTWELYIGPDHRVVAFEYHRGGPKKPSVVIATWAGYKKAGPLLFSTDHVGTADGGALHLTFTDVAVKVTGSDSWINAQ